MWPPSIYYFIFDLICLLPWAVCVRKSFESYSFEDVALNVDTDKNQNLELLLGEADFAKNPWNGRVQAL